MESLKLFLAILIHANAQASCAAEGNSGEFSSDEEIKRLDDVYDDCLQKLNEQFQKVTGYLPVFKMSKEYRSDMDGIVFFKTRLPLSGDMSYTINYDILEIKLFSSCTFLKDKGFGYYEIGTWKLAK